MKRKVKAPEPLVGPFGQLRWPWGINGTRIRQVDGLRLLIPNYTRTEIPPAAALRIFTEVFAQYLAIIESCDSDTLALEAHDFRIDVEAQIQRLYGNGEIFLQVVETLTEKPRSLKATRSALGENFLLCGLWPTKNYFASGK